MVTPRTGSDAAASLGDEKNSRDLSAGAGKRTDDEALQVELPPSMEGRP